MARGRRLVLATVLLPQWMVEELDRLVAEGRFESRSQAIRKAIEELLGGHRGRVRRV